MAKKSSKRLPRGYDGVNLTSKPLGDVLPRVLRRVSAVHGDRPDLILAAWPQLVGPQLAPMTEAVAFNEGMLVVKVKNSTLYSLLKNRERGRLLYRLRQRFPSNEIRGIYFKIG